MQDTAVLVRDLPVSSLARAIARDNNILATPTSDFSGNQINTLFQNAIEQSKYPISPMLAEEREYMYLTPKMEPLRKGSRTKTPTKYSLLDISEPMAVITGRAATGPNPYEFRSDAFPRTANEALEDRGYKHKQIANQLGSDYYDERLHRAELRANEEHDIMARLNTFKRHEKGVSKWRSPFI